MATPTVTQAPYGYTGSKKAHNGPDPKLVQDQLAGLRGLYARYGKARFAEDMFWILRKNPEKGERDILPADNRYWNRRLVPFRHNRIQLDLDKNLALRNILLKPRQAGYTTYMAIMRLLLPALLDPGTGSLLISQNNKFAAIHFSMLKRAIRYFAASDPYDRSQNLMGEQFRAHLLHTVASNRREIIFDQLDSRIFCDSAEVEETGQGITIQHLVATEVARWEGMPEETLANVKEALPQDGTIDLESTANQLGGYFYEECQRAKDPSRPQSEREFKFHFHEWWWHDEYRTSPPAPVNTLTEEEINLRQAFRLDLEQIAWRRKKIFSLRHNFLEKYPEDPITAFLIQGNVFFDKEILRARYLELASYTPQDTYKRWKKFRSRIKNRRYLIGVDVATGRTINSENLDYSTATVLDVDTGEQMASYRARLTPEEFAWELAELGRYYNNALIAVERTGDGGSVILTLQVACQYTNIYKHKEWWKRERKIIEVEGWPTTPKTRPIMLNRMNWLIKEQPETLYDVQLIEECLTFVRDEKGKPAAAEGCYDDTVFACAIANSVRQVLLGYLDPTAVPSEKYGNTPSEFANDDEGSVQ